MAVGGGCLAASALGLPYPLTSNMFLMFRIARRPTRKLRQPYGPKRRLFSFRDSRDGLLDQRVQREPVQPAHHQNEIMRCID